jgi:hypothetical protein
LTYANAISAPPRFQWESNSQYSQPWNCGPTSVTRIACFYRDTWYGVEATRKTIVGMGPYNVNGQQYYGAPAQTPTNAWQQADMLTKRGVPASVRQIQSLDEMHGLVDSGRRPIVVGIEMSRVDPIVRGHNFTGWHAVVFVGPAYVNGMKGVYVNDPNFAPEGYGSDPTRGRRFYSDALLQGAWIANSPRYCVVPDNAKVVAPAPPVFSEGIEMAILTNITIPGDTGRLFNVRAGITLRKGPGATYPVHWTTTGPIQYRLLGFSPGGWVAASNPNSPTGVFFVPPVH